jgi:hypothetical protein
MVVIWLILSVIVGIVAAAKERSFLAFTLLSLVLSPLLGLILVFVTKPNGLRKCPACAEKVKLEATKCKHCGSALEAPPAAPTEF